MNNKFMIVGVILIAMGLFPDPFLLLDEVILYGGGLLSLLCGIRKLLNG